MTKLLQLPEEIIGYILSFAPDYRDNLKKCQAELLENKPIYYSTWETRIDNGPARMNGEGVTIEDVLNIFSYDRSRVKYVNGLGRRVLWARSMEISSAKKSPCSPLHSFRIVKINYGWEREKDSEAWKAISTRKRRLLTKQLTTGYH